jgi:hypothetical protein
LLLHRHLHLAVVDYGLGTHRSGRRGSDIVMYRSGRSWLSGRWGSGRGRRRGKRWGSDTWGHRGGTGRGSGILLHRGGLTNGRLCRLGGEHSSGDARQHHDKPGTRYQGDHRITQTEHGPPNLVTECTSH